MRLTPRTIARVERDFGDRREPAVSVIDSVNIGNDETEGSERIQTAILICAAGNVDRLRDAAALAELDWRDLLVNAGLADEDWPGRVDAYLGEPSVGQ